jgi:hypothetical protein
MPRCYGFQTEQEKRHQIQLMSNMGWHPFPPISLACIWTLLLISKWKPQQIRTWVIQHRCGNDHMQVILQLTMTRNERASTTDGRKISGSILTQWIASIGKTHFQTQPVQPVVHNFRGQCISVSGASLMGSIIINMSDVLTIGYIWVQSKSSSILTDFQQRPTSVKLTNYTKQEFADQTYCHVWKSVAEGKISAWLLGILW